MLRSLKVSWDNLLTVGLKRMPQPFPQVRRRNRGGDNKNAYYNIDMEFFIQENANFHLSKLIQLTKKKHFSNVFLPRVQSINQSIYLFVLCFKTKNTPIYVKKSFQKHRKAAK